MAKLPRLDDLIRCPNGGTDHAYGVFNAPAWNGCIHEKPNKVKRLGLLALLAMKVARATDCQMSARWMGNHQIPPESQHLFHWLLKVVAGIGFAFEQIATPCVVAVRSEGITNSAAVFTGNKHSHAPCLLANLA